MMKNIDIKIDIDIIQKINIKWYLLSSNADQDHLLGNTYTVYWLTSGANTSDECKNN